MKAERRAAKERNAIKGTPPRIRVLFAPDILIQACLEWEASEFRRMPSLEEIAHSNLTWREQVSNIHRYLEWIRVAADHPEEFGGID